jgi:hypothetical protein
MRKLLLSACLSLCLVPGPALAKGQELASASERSSCDAKYYDYLVGKNVDAARDISATSNYRVLTQGAEAGAPQPKRMTLKVDKRNQIVEVACG